MSIDWIEAPYWAEAKGRVHCITTRDIWFNEKVYMYVGDTRPYQWADSAPNLIHNHGRNSVTDIVRRLDPWTGEGLPPVGTVCEFLMPDSRYQFKEYLRHEHKVTVIAHYRGITGCTVAAFTFDYNGGHERDVDSAAEGHFRPIRTPEQIEADERQGAVIDIGDILIANRGIATEYHQAGLIYDAGYRKQVSE